MANTQGGHCVYFKDNFSCKSLQTKDREKLCLWPWPRLSFKCVTKAIPLVSVGNSIKTMPTSAVTVATTMPQVITNSGQVTLERTKRPLILTRPGAGVASAPGSTTVLRFNPASGSAPKIVSTKSLQNLVCEYCKSKPGNFLCAKCNLIRYCSPVCQNNHWPTHINLCGVKTEPPTWSNLNLSIYWAFSLQHGQMRQFVDAIDEEDFQASRWDIL